MDTDERNDLLENLECDLEFAGFNSYPDHLSKMTDEELVELSDMVGDCVRICYKINDKITQVLLK